MSKSVLQIDTARAERRVFRPVSDLTLAEQADEYGDLSLQVDWMKPFTDRRDLLRDAIQEAFDDQDVLAPDAGTFIEGERWRVEVKPKTNQDQIVSIDRVRKAMGKESFWPAATKALNRALGSIKAIVGEPVYETLVTREQTGYRRLVAVAVPPSKAA